LSQNFEIDRKTGQRRLLLVAIACGCLAVGFYYRSGISPKYRISNEHAKQMGYASSADIAKTEADFEKYFPDIQLNGRLTPAEYKLATDTIHSGSRQAQVHMIVAFGFVREQSDRKLIVDLMPKSTIPPDFYGLWMSAFQRWMKTPKDEGLLNFLSQSGNVNAMKMADDLRSAGHA